MRHTNALLGFPADARLLIVNADDFGMCHAINAGVFLALTEGVACSATLMVPCPWALHARQFLQEHPTLPFGIHLTVVCETTNYRWSPLNSRERVESLVDDAGWCYSVADIPKFLAKARL